MKYLLAIVILVSTQTLLFSQWSEIAPFAGGATDGAFLL